MGPFKKSDNNDDDDNFMNDSLFEGVKWQVSSFLEECWIHSNKLEIAFPENLKGENYTSIFKFKATLLLS